MSFSNVCYDSTLWFDKNFCSFLFFRLEKLSVPATVVERSQPVVGNVPGDIKASENVLQIKNIVPNERKQPNNIKMSSYETASSIARGNELFQRYGNSNELILNKNTQNNSVSNKLNNSRKENGTITGKENSSATQNNIDSKSPNKIKKSNTTNNGAQAQSILKSTNGIKNQNPWIPAKVRIFIFCCSFILSLFVMVTDESHHLY